MGVISEFKEFAMRGNVMDMAVGVIIGGAFGKIVSSLVSDIIMPPISMLLGEKSFSSLFIDLSGQGFKTLADAQAAGAPTINYGLFLMAIIDFLIIAFAIFISIRQINKLKKKEPPPEPTEKECPHCFTKISKKATRCPNCTSNLKKS